MIRLEIDGYEIALNENLSLDFYDYNSIFDVEHNRGAFTYDIDIDLRQGNNARLYQHLQRINNTTVYTGRTARLFVEGLPIVKGKEIVLECNGKKAKIQIVCGSSEINTKGNTLRLSELNLGQLPEYTSATALETLNAEPLSVPAVCTPVMVDYVKIPFVTQNVERETVSKMVNLAEYTDLWSNTGSWHGTPTFRGQPYLVIVIERVLEALGWTVTNNILRTMEYSKRLIVVHGYDTRDICDILPDWTVNEFLEQIQRMFNVIFVLNEEYHTVSILNRNVYYSEVAETVVVKQEDIVIDERTPARKYDGNEEYVYNYDSVKYDFPAKVYAYRGDVLDGVNEIVTLHYVSDFSEFNGPSSPYRNDSFYNTAVFFYHVPSDSKWMLAKSGSGQASIKYVFVRVNQFAHARKPTYKENESKETVLKIVPAETLVMAIYLTSPSLIGGVVIPYAQVSGQVGADFSTSSDMGLNQWVEGNAPQKKDTRSEKLYVAQYIGRTSVLADSHNPNSSSYERIATTQYPQVFTHRFIDGRLYGAYSDLWEGSFRDYIMDALWDKPELEDKITFDLNKRIATTYSSNLQVNDKEVYTINIKIHHRLDVTSVYNIAGRRFVCVSLRYQVRMGKLLPYAIGTFLPLK